MYLALLLMLLAIGRLYNQSALKLVRIFQSLIISTCKQSCQFFFFCNANTSVLMKSEKVLFSSCARDFGFLNQI